MLLQIIGSLKACCATSSEKKSYWKSFIKQTFPLIQSSMWTVRYQLGVLEATAELGLSHPCNLVTQRPNSTQKSNLVKTKTPIQGLLLYLQNRIRAVLS